VQPVGDGLRDNSRMEIHRSALVEYPAEDMFDLIEAAEHYPSFLPWCAGATIVARDEDVVVADIVVDWHGARFSFRTRNPKRRPEWMAVTLERGPFRRFEGEWHLKSLAPAACKIEFVLRYEFESAVMRKLAGAVFDRISGSLVDAFVTRAAVVCRRATLPDAPSNPAKGTLS
jgi:ribosome-associated toxin RatA of RatAB toxin-antitoxin module